MLFGMSQPNVLLYQQVAAVAVAQLVPLLDTVVLGEGYDVLDYPEDAASILLSSVYGTADGRAGNGTFTPYTPPLSTETAVTVADGTYPAQSPGARVDHASVKLILKTPRVILGSTYLLSTIAPVFGSAVTTSSADRTLVTITGGATTDFRAAGIRPGDTILLTSSNASPEQSVVRTVASVGEPNAAGLIESGNEVKLRLTAELPASGTGAGQWVYNASGECRIERQITTSTVTSTSTITFPEPGSDTLAIKGGITITTDVTPLPTVADPVPATVTGARMVAYSQLYLSYRARRLDLQRLMKFTSNELQTVNGLPTVVGVGKIDARNPLAVAIKVALANSGAYPVYGYGVASNDSVGHANARSAIGHRAMYATVPLTTDVSIHAEYKTYHVNRADPNYVVANGVRQRFGMNIGSVPIPTASTISAASITGVSAAPGASTGKYRTITIDDNATATVNFRNVVPGDTVIIGLTPSAAAWQNRRGSHTVGHVNSSQDYPASGDDAILEVIPGSTRWDDTVGATSGDIEFQVKSPTGEIKVSNLASTAVSTGAGPTLGTVRYDMLAPTLVGGPYTVAYVESASIPAVTVQIAGFAITITFNGTSHTHTNIAAAVNAHPVVSKLLTAVVTAGGTQVAVAATQSPVAPAAIEPGSGTCPAVIGVNNNLYLQLDDASAHFLTDSVKPGDVLEIPADPNNYASDAFSGRTLSFTIAAVPNENRLLIVNGGDDTASASKELPHFFARDLPDRYIDNTAPNSIHYRVRRLLSKDEQVLALASVAASVRSKRLVLVLPDQISVNELTDGSLPRSSSAVPAVAGDQPGFYAAAAVGGAIAGTPVQQGFSGYGFNGFKALRNSQGYFDERQLALLAEAGLFVFVNETEDSLPVPLHQVTTDPSSIYSQELSCVKNLDYVSIFFLEILRRFLGRFNVTPDTINKVRSALDTNRLLLEGQKIDGLGAPLVSSTITSVAQSAVSADRIDIFMTVQIPVPLNVVALYLVTGGT